MAQTISVEVIMINGDVRYIDPEEFVSFGIQEDAIAVVNSMIRGSRLPLVKAYTMEDRTDASIYINTAFIMAVDVTYN